MQTIRATIAETGDLVVIMVDKIVAIEAGVFESGEKITTVYTVDSSEFNVKESVEQICALMNPSPYSTETI